MYSDRLRSPSTSCWSCSDLKGYPGCILCWWYHSLLDPQIWCVSHLPPMAMPLCSNRWILGDLSSVPCLWSAFLSFSSLPLSSHTAGYPLSTSSWVPLLGCLVPSWSLCGWGHAVHLFTSHQEENHETVTSQSSVYQAYTWRKGWPFIWGHSQWLTTGEQVVMQRCLRHGFLGRLNLSDLWCWPLCCSTQLL